MDALPVTAPSKLIRGQFVRLTYCGQTIDAMVMLASTNGRSLVLGFDGALHVEGGGMFAGSMPLLQDDDGVYRDLVANLPAIIELRQKQ